MNPIFEKIAQNAFFDELEKLAVKGLLKKINPKTLFENIAKTKKKLIGLRKTIKEFGVPYSSLPKKV